MVKVVGNAALLIPEEMVKLSFKGHFIKLNVAKMLLKVTKFKLLKKVTNKVHSLL